MSKTSDYPLCSNWHAMVWTFAFRGQEWACLPCDEAVPMWNGRPKATRSTAYMARKKRKWQDDLHAIAMLHGGATCAVKGECGICANLEHYAFKYWGGANADPTR